MEKWHPMLGTVEAEPGVWRMVDSLGHQYGSVELRRVTGGLKRYRCEQAGELIGWATTLRHACAQVHDAFVRTQGPAPFAGYPDLSGSMKRPG